jgi:ribosome-binding factor A
MTTRRQEKVARIIKESVSDCITNHLNDPRIEGLISVTKVDISPDLRNVDVFISVFGKDEAAQNKTFNAIVHATKRIQVFMAHNLNSKFCPVLHLKNDENFKKTLETMRLIDEAVGNPFDEPETEEENEFDESDEIEDIEEDENL